MAEAKDSGIAINPTDGAGPGPMDPEMASSPPSSGAAPIFTYTASDGSTMPIPQDRRPSSDEWDASKVPPSRFQKRKGSIYSTPSSRDGQVDHNYATKYYEKLAEMGYAKK